MDEVFVLIVFRDGEFDEIAAFKKKEGAQKKAAMFLSQNISVDDFEMKMNVDDHDEWVETRDNLLELYKSEAYASMIECWDEWVLNQNFDGPTAFNFDIVPTQVEA